MLVTGARGFIGRQIAAALSAAGHEVIFGVRKASSSASSMHIIECDFARDTDPDLWIPRLAGIEAVVNCVGILRERGADRFEQVHVDTPTALFEACVPAGVRRIIQVSALGDPRDGEFVASKHRGDDNLTKLDLDWVILRPSVVYSPRGSYGGTSLLRAMAALPLLLLLPGDGQQLIEPISGEDLSALVAALLRPQTASRLIIEVVGPDTLTLESYLRSWRRWLGFSEPWVIRVPVAMVAAAAWLGELWGSGPFGMTMYRMLSRGNTATPRAERRLSDCEGWSAKPLSRVLAEQPSFVQDRWHARLYVVAPALRIAIGVVWVASAFVGFLTPRGDIQQILAGAGVTHGALELVYGASMADLVLGALLLFGKRTAVVGALMFASLSCYTLFIGIDLPHMWFEPFGGLLKNLALAPALLAMMVLADRK